MPNTEATAPLTITEVPGPQLVPAPKPIVQQRMGLYDVTLESLQIEEALIESGGELTPEIEARFDTLLTQGPRAIEAAVFILRELKASAQAAADEAERLKRRKDGFAKNEDALKERVRIAVDSPMFGGKVKTGKVTVWTQKAADRVAIEFQALEESLENLHAMHPNLVKVETTYKLDEAAVKQIWAEERPAREAYEALINERERCIAEALEKGVDRAAAEKQYRKPPAPKSKLPAVLAIEDVAGRRFLQVR